MPSVEVRDEFSPGSVPRKRLRKFKPKPLSSRISRSISTKANDTSAGDRYFNSTPPPPLMFDVLIGF